MNATATQAIATDERRADRAELDKHLADQTGLPHLKAAMDAARAFLTETVAKLEAKFVTRQRAYVNTAASVARGRRIFEGKLRAGAPPFLDDHGPLLTQLVEEMGHVRQHAGGVGIREDHDLVRADKLSRVGKQHREALQTAQARVTLAQRAEEILPALADALDELHELQLEISPDPVKVARAILAEIPKRCACGKPFDFSLAE